MEFQLSCFKHAKECDCKSAAFNMSPNLENSAVATVLGKVVFISIQKKGNSKECSTYHAIVLISPASKVILKILQAKLHNTWTENFQMYKLVWGTRDQIVNIHWIIEKAREFQKKIYIFTDYAKAFHCVDHNKLWKILKRMGVADHLTPLLKVCM